MSEGVWGGGWDRLMGGLAQSRLPEKEALGPSAIYSVPTGRPVG